MPGSSFSILPKHVLLLLQHRMLPLLPTSVAEMACSRRCCEAGWGKVLKDTEDDCFGDGLLSRVGDLGLLVQVIYIYICLKKFGFIFPPGYLSK